MATLVSMRTKKPGLRATPWRPAMIIAKNQAEKKHLQGIQARSLARRGMGLRT